LEFRRQVVQLGQRVIGLLASNIGSGRFTLDLIRELAETFDNPVSTVYADIRSVEAEAGAARRNPRSQACRIRPSSTGCLNDRRGRF
jgi:hypothetical protein